MVDLSEIEPTAWQSVMQLVSNAGVDVSDWANFAGKNPAANPKYAFSWSFKGADRIVLCIWHDELQMRDGKIVFIDSVRQYANSGHANWKKRALEFDGYVRVAYRDALPVRVIVLAGAKRDADDEDSTASGVEKRLLDTTPWAVTEYDFDTGQLTLTRAAEPIEATDGDDPEHQGFEGEKKRRYVLHRRREADLRAKKIKASLIDNKGKLVCEVPRCGFDFNARYGKVGEGFAHVHHLSPLATFPESGGKVTLKDLAIVCATATL